MLYCSCFILITDLDEFRGANSESGFQFIPPRHNLKIFSLQNCKIANISKKFPEFECDHQQIV